MQSEVSEIGALQLACVAVDRERRWELEFDLRATPATAIEVQDNGTPDGLKVQCDPKDRC